MELSREGGVLHEADQKEAKDQHERIKHERWFSVDILPTSHFPDFDASIALDCPWPGEAKRRCHQRRARLPIGVDDENDDRRRIGL